MKTNKLKNTSLIGENTFTQNQLGNQQDLTSRKIGEILVSGNYGITKEHIKGLLKKQFEFKLKGVDVSLGELAIRFKLISRENMIDFLIKSGVKLRLGELLYVSKKISLKKLTEALSGFYKKQLSGEKILFGDYLVENDFISREELAIFLKTIEVKLRVGEILLNRGLISEQELSELLLEQDKLKKSGNYVKLLDLLSSKNVYGIDYGLLQSILIEQKVNSQSKDKTQKSKHDEDSIVLDEELSLSDKEMEIYFGKIKKANEQDKTSEINPWARESVR